MYIDINTIEGKILKVITEKYSISVDELVRITKLRLNTLEIALNKLYDKKIIIIEKIENKKYIRLLKNDIKFIGVKPLLYRKIKKSHKLTYKNKKNEYDMMYI